MASGPVIDGIYYQAFGPDANCTLEFCPVEVSVYGYLPNLAANIVFIALYALSAIVHIYLGIRWKTWFFMSCMIVGAINGILGYVGRVILHNNPFDFFGFIIQIVCVTCGPVYYCAAIYVTLAAAIKFFGPELSRFNPNLFIWVFIPFDIVCLILQASGGALSTTSSGDSSLGVNLALAGLALQVAVLVAFCAAFGDYLWRYFHSDVYRKRTQSGGGAMGARVKLFFGFMAAAVLLILIRCGYRLAELREGYDGELVREEGLFIGLESVMVVLAVFCLCVAHPGFAGFARPMGEGEKGSESSANEFETERI
ncbi:RTA1 like protein-domain-containing protein [Bombardia bombarda]|uniref:RTA1 like protein-domain-containing protein n=1 Tax=Bombardia bombarda TaxID=252184 RepID=A0AA40C2D3_9PEZI|nr:RTA1 like protein-domain-containing protein [Bombardia bombarda]